MNQDLNLLGKGSCMATSPISGSTIKKKNQHWGDSRGKTPFILKVGMSSKGW